MFGETEFLDYQQALIELADVYVQLWILLKICRFYLYPYLSSNPCGLIILSRVKAYSSSTSLDQHHQSAAKDLTGSPVRGTPSTIQVTYLPSTGQRSKRPKHFLELKSFKDNYNTLESTL